MLPNSDVIAPTCTAVLITSTGTLVPTFGPVQTTTPEYDENFYSISDIDPDNTAILSLI